MAAKLELKRRTAGPNDEVTVEVPADSDVDFRAQPVFVFLAPPPTLVGNDFAATASRVTRVKVVAPHRLTFVLPPVGDDPMLEIPEGSYEVVVGRLEKTHVRGVLGSSLSDPLEVTRRPSGPPGPSGPAGTPAVAGPAAVWTLGFPGTPPTPAPHEPCSCMDVCVVEPPASFIAGPPRPPAVSEAGVCYGTGDVRVDATDVDPTLFGIPWGHRRSYMTPREGSFDSGAGNDWIVADWPYLEMEQDGGFAVVRGACNVRWFDYAAGAFSGRYGTHDELRWSPSTGELTLRTSNGAAYVFYGFGGDAGPPGRLKRFETPGVQTIHCSYDGPRLIAVERALGDGARVSLRYDYRQGANGVDQLQEVTLVRTAGATVLPITRARYRYYDSLSPHGAAGDLAEVRHEHYTKGDWKLVARHYYRYYASHKAGQELRGLKLALGPEAVGRLMRAGRQDLDRLSDELVRRYCDSYFEYEPGSMLVKKAVLDGGKRTHEFTFTRKSVPDGGFGEWQTKAVETLPGGDGVLTVFTNRIGQVLLRSLSAGETTSHDAYRYGALAELLGHAEPSAVLGYDEGEGDLGIRLRGNDGLVHVFGYYDKEGPAEPQGYPEYYAVRQGAKGAEVRRREWKYATRDLPVGTIHPVEEEVAFGGDSGENPRSTRSTYDWRPNTFQPRQRITVDPPVGPEQHGDGSSTFVAEWFDDYGNVEFVRGRDGTIARSVFDSWSLRPRQFIQDYAGPLPPGWQLNPGPHLEAKTDFTVDAFGRVVEVLGPEHDVSGRLIRTAAWSLFSNDEVRDQVWITEGYFDGERYATSDPPAPVEIKTFDKAGREIERVVSVRDPARAEERPTLRESYTDRTRWARWERRFYDDHSALESERIYHRIPPAGDGVEGEHYGEYRFLSDAAGRVVGTRSRGGTIGRKRYDAHGRLLEVWVGQNDSGWVEPRFCSSGEDDTRLVSAREYDAKGSGNLTRVTRPVDDDSAHDRVTVFDYDFRNRRTRMSRGGTVTEWTFDNLDRERFRTVLASNGSVLSVETTEYDDRDNVFRQTRSGTKGTGRVVSLFWRGAGGGIVRMAQEGSGQFVSIASDALGRRTQIAHGYRDSRDPEVEHVVEREVSEFDGAGNRIRRTREERVAAATTYRTTTELSWFDELGRVVSTADYGESEPGSVARPHRSPGSSGKVRVTRFFYNARGERHATVDASGLTTRMVFDDEGRRMLGTKSSAAAGGVAQQVRWAYGPDGKVSAVVNSNPLTGDQLTTFEYGSSVVESGVSRSDLLVRTTYPDSRSPGDAASFAHNRQCEVVRATDMAGTTHEYEYDADGRRIVDRVPAVGAGIDASVRRIETAYDGLGNVLRSASFDAPAGGNPVNDVTVEYDALGQPVREWQEHQGAVDATTPSVQYRYGAGPHVVRREAIVYPNGRTIELSFGEPGSADHELDRIREIRDGAGGPPIARYAYRGLANVSDVFLPEPGLELESRLDRFATTQALAWRSAASGVEVVSHRYTHDRVNNLIAREDLGARRAKPPRALDERYALDELHRVVEMQRGRYASGAVSQRVARQSWRTELGTSGIDPSGNWTSYREDATGDGCWDVEQSRQHNAANEIVCLDSRRGPAWARPGYDAAGNLASMPSGLDPAVALDAVYDAWNRLVRVARAGTAVGEYQYDGLDRRVSSKPRDGDVRHFFYSDQWQVLEERVGADPAVADRQFVWGLRHVDDLLFRDRAPEGRSTLDERVYSLQDDHFNVVALSGRGGDPIERRAYQTYGAPIPLDATFSPARANGIQWEYLFAGYRYDAETGLYQVRKRYFNPQLGQWCSRDPLQYEDGYNMLEYVAGNPMTDLDPEGTFRSDRIGAYRNLTFLCWPTANDVVGDSVTRNNTHPRAFINRQVRTIVGCEGGSTSWDCRYNILRPDIAMMRGPIPGGTGDLWEIKPASPADALAGLTQALLYVADLNHCCVNISLGACGLGNGTFGWWANTINPIKCGDFLGWGCIPGLVMYIWTPSRAAIAAALAAAFIVLAPEVSIPTLPEWAPVLAPALGG